MDEVGNSIPIISDSPKSTSYGRTLLPPSVRGPYRCLGCGEQEAEIECLCYNFVSVRDSSNLDTLDLVLEEVRKRVHVGALGHAVQPKEMSVHS